MANTGVVFGSVSESPVTPKVGLQYNISDNDLVYVSAANFTNMVNFGTPESVREVVSADAPDVVRFEAA